MYEGENDILTEQIINAAIEVHHQLGNGFLEKVYQDALAVEMQRRGIPFVKEAPLKVFYKGVELGAPYKADFICFGSIILELKALSHFSGTEEAQVIHYLAASNLHKALLINFGEKKVRVKRYVH